MLKKLSLMVSLVGLIALLLAPQGWSQQQFPPATRNANRLYNPQAVETLAGNVVALNRIHAKRPGRPDRVTMVLQTGKETVKIHLGPADYLDRQALRLAPGDQVEVKGMRITRSKATLFIAGTVKRGDQILQLRDDATGRPLWAKGQRRSLT
ncbi:MAG: DNA-binding protein [Desulfobaccales bacterium]